MTPEDLKALILSDTEASEHFAKGEDAACAKRCSEIAPKQIVDTELRELDLFALAKTPAEVMQIETILQTLEEIAKANSLIRRILGWLRINGGLNFGNPLIRNALVTPLDQGGCGLTPEQAAPLLAAAERPANITEQMVEKLRTGT